MRGLKKTIGLGVLGIVICFMTWGSSQVEAKVTKPVMLRSLDYENDFSKKETNKSYGTKGQLKVNTHIKFSVPWNPFFTECTSKSVGDSNFSFRKNETTYKYSVSEHSITAQLSGLGAVDITGGSSGGNVRITGSGNSKTFTTKDAKWSYVIKTSIWRAYGYKEDHAITYRIKQGSRSLKSVTLSCSVRP